MGKTNVSFSGAKTEPNPTDVACVSDLFSDESSFYGSEETTASLERRANAYNPKEYWDVVEWNLQCLASRVAHNSPKEHKRKRESDSPPGLGSQPVAKSNKIHTSRASPNPTPNATDTRPYNPCEGDTSAKQLTESLEDFLTRLPPSTTSISTVGPWIWIANPTSPYRPTTANITAFKASGFQALASYLTHKSQLESQHPQKPPSAITRMLNSDRATLQTHLLSLAQHHGVTTGKWMLFPPLSDVDAVWATVSRAVVTNQLGSAAKVATNDGESNPSRLVCIYTLDFADVDDVKRVLRRLRELGLCDDAEHGKRPIYYKCDAYTCLDIASGNDYKLKASLYGSRDLGFQTAWGE